MPEMEKRRIKWMTFINDNDGMTSRDFVIGVSIGSYFLFLSAGLIMLLFGNELDEMYLQLLDSTMPIVITVVGGEMGVKAVETFKKPAERVKEEEKIEYEEYSGEETEWKP